MEKIIKQEHLDGILGLLERCNVGVRDYFEVLKLFKSLPENTRKINEEKIFFYNILVILPYE